MGEYIYRGLKAFEADEGTLWNQSGVRLSSIAFETAEERAKIREDSQCKHFVWFIDDELGNREWFKDRHREHWAVVTFSSREHAVRALARGFPCDAVVTDIFFPQKPPSTEEEANGFLSIYDKIKSTPVGGLHDLWQEERKRGWSLAGFSVAHDFSDLTLSKGKRIPVFLFSRKATLLLGTSDFIGDQPVTRNTYWLIEKPSPDEMSSAERAANIQRARVEAVLEDVEEWPLSRRTEAVNQLNKHFEDLICALQQLGDAIATSEKLTTQQKQDAARDIATIKSQIKKQHPVREVIKATWVSLEKAATVAAVAETVQKVAQLLRDSL